MRGHCEVRCTPFSVLPVAQIISVAPRRAARRLGPSSHPPPSSSLRHTPSLLCPAPGSDRRFGANFLTVACDFQKIFRMHDRLYVGMNGLPTDVQTMCVLGLVPLAGGGGCPCPQAACRTKGLGSAPSPAFSAPLTPHPLKPLHATPLPQRLSCLP
jgi:hypothetical protein